MKKYYLFFALLVVGFSAQAVVAAETYRRPYGDAFIFVEGGVEFAIYPDGQFDFYYDHHNRGYQYKGFNPGRNFSYNSGYNYDPYVQYDDFGAVIQIEHVPVYYDFYGRIVRAGGVEISYNRFGRLARIGHLFLHYNHRNYFTHYTGYINVYNRHYVYRPWHQYYMRPYSYAAIVYHQPYRSHYHPNRMKYGHYQDYYKKHHDNDFRRRYYRPGDRVTTYHRGRRTDARESVATRSNQHAQRDRQVYRERSERRQEVYNQPSQVPERNLRSRDHRTQTRSATRTTTARTARSAQVDARNNSRSSQARSSRDSSVQPARVQRTRSVREAPLRNSVREESRSRGRSSRGRG